MESGAANVVTAHRAIAKGEDRIVGNRWFPENTLSGKSGGMALRFFKLFALDMPIDYFSAVLTHEYFGHGARYREFKISHVDYGFDMPPPYGAGGGQAAVDIPGTALSNHQLLAIWTGGLESHALINRTLGMRWMAGKSINYREASLYFWTWQISFNYINGSVNDLSLTENDPRAYVRIINANAGFNNPDSLSMSLAYLQRRNRIGLLNPFLWFTLYTQLRTYLWDGNSSNRLPVIPVGDLGYLPSFRLGLTPFGPEYHFENFVSAYGRIVLVDFRLGDETFHRSWGGIGLYIQNFCDAGSASFDVRLDFWQQPRLDFGPVPIEHKGGGSGGAFAVRAFYPLAAAVAGVGEVGYKSVGFLEGFSLDASLIVGVGLAFNL